GPPARSRSDTVAALSPSRSERLAGRATLTRDLASLTQSGESPAMFFNVLGAGGHPPPSARSEAYLITDNWDDWFEFSTLYSLTFVDGEGVPHNVGGVKIGQFGVAKGQRRPA